MKTDLFMKNVSIKILCINVIILILMFSGCTTPDPRLSTLNGDNEIFPPVEESQSPEPIQGGGSEVPIVPTGTGDIPGGSVSGSASDPSVPQPNPTETQTGQPPVDNKTTSVGAENGQKNQGGNISLVSGTKEQPQTASEGNAEANQKTDANESPVDTKTPDYFKKEMDGYCNNPANSSATTTVNVSQPNLDSLGGVQACVTFPMALSESNDSQKNEPDNKNSDNKENLDNKEGSENKEGANNNEESSKPNENLTTENQRIYRYQFADSSKYSSDFRSKDETYFVQRTVSKLPIASLPNVNQTSRPNSLTPIAPVAVPITQQRGQYELSRQYSSQTNQSTVRTVVIP